MNTDRFKFRVWSTKEESYGGFYHDSASIQEDGHLSVHYWCKGEYATDILGDGFEEGDYIIEQCTGLKDKNGNLIYEGDIICYDDTPYNVYATKKTGPVVWHKAMFCIHYKNELGDFYDTVGANDDFWSRKTEIVGNIHGRM